MLDLFAQPKNKKKFAISKKLIICIIISIIILLILFIPVEEETDILDNEIIGEEIIKEEIIDNEVDEVEYIKVDIKGAVVNPSVYEIKKGSRVIDLVSLAGGFKEEANTANVNLSKILVDEMVVVICTNEEIASLDIKVEEVFVCECEEDTSLININTASISDLMTLTGIGEKTAEDIIEYRNNNTFLTIEDIMEVSGIGEATFENIKDFITV